MRGDDDDGEGSPPPSTKETQTKEEPSPAELREALKNTATKPVLPKPTGSPPRRLVKEDIVKGKGPAAKPGDTVTVNYVGVAFSTGEEFDASWDRGQPIKVPLGARPGDQGLGQGPRRHARGRPADPHDPAGARLRARRATRRRSRRTRRSCS